MVHIQNNAFTELTELLSHGGDDLDEIEKLIKKASNEVLEDDDIMQYQVLLYNLIKYDRIDILEIFIKYINIDIQVSESEYTVLIATIQHSYINNLGENEDYMFDDNIVSQLLEYTKDINVMDEDGYTALDHIMESLNSVHNFNRNYVIYNIIKIMLEKGADVFMNDSRLIECAITDRRHDILLLFLENTNGNKIDIHLLYKAIRYLMAYDNKNYDIIEKLIQSVDDINETDDDGDTILDWCKLWIIQNESKNY